MHFKFTLSDASRQSILLPSFEPRLGIFYNPTRAREQFRNLVSAHLLKRVQCLSVSKSLSAPKPWKNTYFWISAFLVLVSLAGAIRGQETIRDPGQLDENGLVFIYLAAAVAMGVNGWISHTAYIRQYNEQDIDAELGTPENSLAAELKKADKKDGLDQTIVAENQTEEPQNKSN